MEGLTPKEILNEYANKAERMFNELRAVQKLPELSLSANHEIGVALCALRYNVVEKLRKLAGTDNLLRG